MYEPKSMKRYINFYYLEILLHLNFQVIFSTINGLSEGMFWDFKENKTANCYLTIMELIMI